jgi:hypothetical protein
MRSFTGCGVVVLVTTFVACGGGGEQRATRPPARVSVEVLRIGCEQSWTPNRVTFANPRWRRESIRIGPVTLLNARRLARVHLRELGVGSVKIRTLVRPRTAVTLAIGREARDVAGFVPLSNGGVAGIDAAKPVLSLQGCPGVPRDAQVIRGLADVGYPVSVAVSTDRCVAIEVTEKGRPTQRRVVSFGAGRCRA